MADESSQAIPACKALQSANGSPRRRSRVESTSHIKAGITVSDELDLAPQEDAVDPPHSETSAEPEWLIADRESFGIMQKAEAELREPEEQETIVAGDGEFAREIPAEDAELWKSFTANSGCSPEAAHACADWIEKNEAAFVSLFESTEDLQGAYEWSIRHMVQTGIAPADAQAAVEWLHGEVVKQVRNEQG